MERRLKCGVCAAAALVLVLCFGMEQKTRAMQTAGNAQTTLVIDAGHGGFDGGAVGADGTAEQDINLSIAKRVQVLANFFGVPTAMTRPDENALDYNPSRTVRENKIADIKAREKLVNSIPSPVFLSIHLNKFSDAQYHGAQVSYSTGNVQSKPLAEQIQQCLIDGCDPLNHRKAKQADSAIYLMKKLDCPAVIIECGFLSNPAEEARLRDEAYHKQLAAAVICGYESPKWYGKCPSCGAWNTMSEFKEKPVSAARGTNTFQRGESRPTLLKDIDTGDESRFHSGIGELDRVLGGGAVHGSFVLVGGEPGIGKSTLLLQMCQEMCKNARVLYVSGEESLKQIKIRAARLHISSPELYILAETDMEQIINETELLEPDILIVDSIQTVYKRDLTAAPGGTTQIKECAMSLMQYAKNRNVTIFIVGHVNKEGTLAGPKILEHMVDCVLYFEGESAGPFRCLRAAKNRYGSTNEIGVFEMSDHGLLEVQNPSAAMLAGHPQGASGNCIACVMEGSRPLLAEVQALAAKTQFGVPRRTAAGVDYNRMVLLLAILEKRCGLFLSSSDVYVNVVGGMRLDEPGVDLPMVLAIASSFRDKPLPEGVMSFGEVGLTGELRAVSNPGQRINEAYRLGFHTCIMPMQDVDEDLLQKMNIVRAKTVGDAIRAVL